MSDDTPGSVLFLEPALGADSAELALDYATDSAEPTSLLTILYGESVASRRRSIESCDESVSSTAYITVDPAGSTDFSTTNAVRTVADPGDLTGVGMAFTDWLTARDEAENAVVSIEGLSTLLQYVSTERAFRFLHAIVGKCRERGVSVTAHITPTAQDDQTLAQFRQLFDEEYLVDSPLEASRSSALATDGGSEPPHSSSGPVPE